MYAIRSYYEIAAGERQDAADAVEDDAEIDGGFAADAVRERPVV